MRLQQCHGSIMPLRPARSCIFGGRRSGMTCVIPSTASPPVRARRMAESAVPTVRDLAIEAIARSATLRATRTALSQVAMMAASPHQSQEAPPAVRHEESGLERYLPASSYVEKETRVP